MIFRTSSALERGQLRGMVDRGFQTLAVRPVRPKDLCADDVRLSRVVPRGTGRSTHCCTTAPLDRVDGEMAQVVCWPPSSAAISQVDEVRAVLDTDGLERGMAVKTPCTIIDAIVCREWHGRQQHLIRGSRGQTLECGLTAHIPRI